MAEAGVPAQLKRKQHVAGAHGPYRVVLGCEDAAWKQRPQPWPSLAKLVSTEAVALHMCRSALLASCVRRTLSQCNSDVMCFFWHVVNVLTLSVTGMLLLAARPVVLTNTHFAACCEVTLATKHLLCKNRHCPRHRQNHQTLLNFCHPAQRYLSSTGQWLVALLVAARWFLVVLLHQLAYQASDFLLLLHVVDLTTLEEHPIPPILLLPLKTVRAGRRLAQLMHSVLHQTLVLAQRWKLYRGHFPDVHALVACCSCSIVQRASCLALPASMRL